MRRFADALGVGAVAVAAAYGAPEPWSIGGFVAFVYFCAAFWGGAWGRRGAAIATPIMGLFALAALVVDPPLGLAVSAGAARAGLLLFRP